jgi:hypothetical protein
MRRRGHAVSTAENAIAARVLIDDFVAEFRVAVANDVFGRGFSIPADGATLLAASAGLRQEILDACLPELTIDISHQDPIAPTYCGYCATLTTSSGALRGHVQTPLDDGVSDLAGLGARFLTIQPEACGGRRHHEFLDHDFNKLVPKEVWGKYPVDEFEDEGVDCRACPGSRRVLFGR